MVHSNLLEGGVSKILKDEKTWTRFTDSTR